MKLRRMPAWHKALCFILANSAVSAFALETSGYLRTGFNTGTDDTGNACFKLPGAKSKYRFGNECEQYAEVDIRHDFPSLEDGSILAVEGMPAVMNPYGETLKFNGESGGRVRLVQAFASLRKSPLLNGGTFWAGRRYYNRKNIGISDFVYWNQSATGFGFDQVAIGGLRYSYVFSRKDSVFQERSVTRQDFNVIGFQTNPGGELELGTSIISRPGGNSDSHGGWSVGVQHYQYIAAGNLNKAAFQYGQGPGVGLGSTGDVSYGNNVRSWRILDAMDLQLTERFGIQLETLYQRNINQHADGDDWLSLGVRTTYGLTDQIKLIADLGYDRIKADEGVRWLSKNSLAVAWSPKGPSFRARPELRLYVTQAYWSRAAQTAANLYSSGSALSDTGPFGSRLNGSQAGVQLEYWW